MSVRHTPFSPKRSWKTCWGVLCAVLVFALSACTWEEVAVDDRQPVEVPQSEEELLLAANTELLRCDDWDGVRDIEIELTNPLDVEVFVVVWVDLIDVFGDVEYTEDLLVGPVAPGESEKVRQDSLDLGLISLDSCAVSRVEIL